MSLAALGPLALIGGGISNAFAANSRQNAFSDLIGQAQQNPAGIFGSKPAATTYNPLYLSDPGYAGIAGDTIKGDQKNLPDAAQLTSDINKAITASSRQRIEGWDPGFQGQLDSLYSTASDTLKGRLPYSDALAISADRGRLANDLGMSGGGGPQIAADLGLKRLDLMTQTGPNLMNSITSMLNTVDPIQRHATPQDFLLTPSQTVPLAVNENQFGANFAAQQAILAALPNPQQQGLFNLQLQQAGMNAGSGTGNLFSSLAGPLAMLFGGGQQNGFGQFGGSQFGGGQSLFGSQMSPFGTTGAQFGQGSSLFGTPSIFQNPFGQSFQVGNGGFTPINKALPVLN